MSINAQDRQDLIRGYGPYVIGSLLAIAITFAIALPFYLNAGGHL